MKVTKRIISILLILGVMLTSIPVSAFEKPSNAETILQNGYAPTQDKYAIYPIPRSAAYKQGSFTLGNQLTVVSENGIDASTNQFLDEILEDYGRTKTTAQTISGGANQILLGIKGSGGAVDAWADSHLALSDADLFTRTDAYLLSADNGTIIILGKDTNAVYYGLATLQMMFSSFNGAKFLNVQIEDYAGMKMRGFIEGFYGGWTYEGRESLMRFARDVKMNTYIYASKTDSYHKNDQLYPTDQINKIKELVAIGDETKVKYCWSIHLSYFFSGLPADTQTQDYQTKFNERFERLEAKFQQLYDAGVRKFAVLNDDFGSGSHTEVVRLLNKLDDEFLVPKGCDNLSYCMQGYNKSWSNTGELTAMRSLNESIDLFWTGNDVNSPITQDTIDFVKEQTGHDAVFWLNYPVNEHAKSGVYLGEISHYVRDDVTGLAGAVSNPSCLTEANKVGLFQLGSLFWNNHNYLAQAESIWEESFKYLQPEVYQSYLTIARNVANCPGSVRVPNGFSESEYISDSLDAVAEKIKKGQPISEDENTQILIDAFSQMLTAIDVFRANCTNDTLIADLDVWLKSLHDVATAGKASLEALIAMEQNNINQAWASIGTAGKAWDTWDSYTYVEPSQGATVIAQAGSKRLVPFAKKALDAAKKQILPILDPSAETPPSYFGVIHGIERTDTAEFAKAYDGNTSSYASFQSGIQQLGDYFGVDLGKSQPIHSIDMLQGKDDSDHDFFHNVALEYSDTGEADDWTEILKYDNDDAPRHIEKTYQDDSLTARYIRLRLIKTGTENKKDYWTHIREITINGGSADKEPEYGLYASEGINGTVTLNSLDYCLNQETEQLLGAGGYIGIKLKELSRIQSVAYDASKTAGLTLQYSDNSRIWTDMPASPDGIAARYVRLYNGTGHEINFTLPDFKVSVYGNAVDLSVADFNPEYTNLKEGSWKNLFDGKYDTYVWTNTEQKTGHYIIIDFGTQTPLYDFTITQAVGNPKFYNAEFYLSTDKTNWGSPVTSVAEANGTVTGPHYTTDGEYIKISRNDLNGIPARYMKILITKDHGYFLRLNEIEINKTISASGEYVGALISETLKGDLDKIIDGDISSVYTSAEPSDGTDALTYPITENNRLSSVTFLQNASAITNAAITANIWDGTQVVEKSLGTLNQGMTKFEHLEDEGDILSITVTWPQGTIPSLYEIITAPITGERTHTLSFRGEGAPAETLSIGEGKNITLPQNTAQIAGKEFCGWTDGANTYAAGTNYVMGLKDVTLDAVWNDADDIKITAITVTPVAADMTVGDTLQLSKTIAPQNATNPDVLWSSDKETVVSVDLKTGKATALAAGTAVITASAEEDSSIFGKCTITVKEQPPIKVTSVKVTPDTLQLNIGDTKKLKATASPSNAADKTVTWHSLKPDVVSVDPKSGLVKAVSAGTAKIKAKAKDGSGTYGICTVTVKETIRENKTYTVGDFRYTVTSLTNRKVTLAKSTNSNLKKITVPDTIKLQGKKYTVTAIGNNAFINHKKASSASIGKYVVSIGKNAFSGCTTLSKAAVNSTKLQTISSNAFLNCKKLKSVTLKSASLKQIGKNAFKGIYKKAVIKVPSKAYKKYRKLFKNKGQAKTVKIKK